MTGSELEVAQCPDDPLPELVEAWEYLGNISERTVWNRVAWVDASPYLSCENATGANPLDGS